VRHGGYHRLSEVLDAAAKQGNPFQLTEHDWESFGIHLFQIGQPENCLIVLNKNVALHPDVAEAYGTLAVIYRLQGNTELANQNHQKFVELKPNKP
jgi:Flp pilus assembly protein TadD